MANQNNDLDSMTLPERMNTINGDDKDKHTFKEALNKWLKVSKPKGGPNHDSNKALAKK